MKLSWKDSIYLQREQLARLLREPIARLAEKCVPLWGDREQLNSVLQDGFGSIPHCTYLYCVGTDGVQICDNISQSGRLPEHFGRDRSQRPYMKEAVPSWGFLLSDAYISLMKSRPSLTALQVVNADSRILGYLGADFDLRNLPVTAKRYDESGSWRQVRGDPSIRNAVMYQCRVESQMDRHLDQTLSILEELLANRGVFQCSIHFSSSQAIIWTLDDPYRYRMLDDEALGDPDICLVYPSQSYPPDAVIPARDIVRILDALREMRMADENIYLRMSSINIFNGMISLTFSCDGSHYMRYDEFLSNGTQSWFGIAA
ncbi:MAG: PDC sensor domain-containing protein [Gallionella sp.]|nr:PDC sensor domain-containing protein [Gallionella sp.]